VTPILPPAAEAWTAMAEALLIGLLFGVQREMDRDERHAGLRDFLIIGLAGGLCALVQQPWLTVTALACLTVLLGVFRWQHPERTGITTELAAVAAFLLAYLAGLPNSLISASVAVGLTIVIVFFLEAKAALQKFFTERMTESEFNATLRFLAVIFIVFPVLPEGAFGPYSFLEPRKIWLFIILVSTISYVGYFLVKFLGAERGLLFTSVLGGLASTTAATSAFARDCKENPAQAASYSWATVLANSIQFPRLLILLAAISPPLLRVTGLMLAAMTAAGLLVAWLLNRQSPAGGPDSAAIQLRNPFRFIPALKFGLIFAAVLFITKWATAEFGSQALLLAGFVGGALDTDAIILSLADLFTTGKIGAVPVDMVVLVAIASNALVKTVIAYSSGVRGFGHRVLAGFAAMIAAALAVRRW